MRGAPVAYRIALRAYPAAFRTARGDEVLATLAEVSPSVRPRELASLLFGGLRMRLARGEGEAPATRIWSPGCRLAALLLFLLIAAGALYPIAWDAWYGRLAMTWPHAGYHLVTMPVSLHRLGWMVVAAALPLAGASALVLGRPYVAIGASVMASAVAATGRPSGASGALSLGTAASLLSNASLLASLVVLATPAVLLWASARIGDAPARFSAAWLSVPVILACLSLAFYTTTITFWPLGVLMIAWFLTSPAAPRLGVAAFGVLLPTCLVVTPAAISQPQYEYAVLVAAGAAVLAAASLVSALAASRRRA